MSKSTPQYSKIAFINWKAENLSRESVYTAGEIAWIMEILYKHLKNREATEKAIDTVVIKSANSNLATLFSLYKNLIEHGIIKPLDARRNTFKPAPKNPTFYINRLSSSKNVQECDATMLNSDPSL